MSRDILAEACRQQRRIDAAQQLQQWRTDYASLQKALKQITGTNAVQGVSGQIAFGTDNDPINKAIVVLYVDQDGHIHLNSVQGCFLVNQCKT